MKTKIKIKVGSFKIFKVLATASERKQLLNIFSQCWDNSKKIILNLFGYNE